MKETYCFEILNNITKTDLKVAGPVNFEADGLVAVVEDQFNKQKYQIKITPIKEAVQ